MDDDVKTISAKIPVEVYKEMLLRVPEGDRSSFIRDAIAEKLLKTPKPDRVLELEQRVGRVEKEVSEVKKYLADLELLTYGEGKANPHAFCLDDLDHKIIDHLLHYKGVTTPELAESLQTNRWLVLNRLRRIQKESKKQLGRSLIEFYAGERSGKKKAWWINERFVDA
jgi:hypothetical protein